MKLTRHKIELYLFGSWLRKLFYQGRLGKNGNNNLLKEFLRNINQRLMEGGYSVPWVMTREECQDYWASITNEEQLRSELRPHSIATRDMGIAEAMHDFWTPQVSIEDSILELGCNCGAKLNVFYKLGYEKLSCIEINRSAIEEMGRSFPNLARTANIYAGSLEELLPVTPTNCFDVIITMGVLFHIHPASNFIFSEMVRVARKYIAIVEEESACCSYVFPRNYRRVFEKLGCLQIKSTMITKRTFPNVKQGLGGFMIRMFAIPKENSNEPTEE